MVSPAMNYSSGEVIKTVLTYYLMFLYVVLKNKLFVILNLFSIKNVVLLSIAKPNPNK